MKPRCALFFFLAFSLFLSIAAHAQQGGDVQLWLTTRDRSELFARQNVDLHFSNSRNQFPTIHVQDNQQFQSIDGFGFALTGGSAELLMRMTPDARSALLKELFSPEGNGIGVSYLRISIGSSDMNDHVFSYDDMPAGETDVDLKHFSLDPDRKDLIPALKEILAIDPGMKILGSPWSPPPWMKTNDNSKGGSLKPEYYGVYAQYFVKYIEGMKAAGVPLDTITVQNEPLTPNNNPSLAMFANEEDTFIRDDLGPAFEKAGIRTKILLYDHNPDVPSYPLSILKDPAASKYVDGTAFHLYGGEVDTLTMVHGTFPDKNLYLTEQSVTDPPFAGWINIAEPVSRVLIGATRNWSKNVLLWNLAADPDDGPHTIGGCPVCRGALTLDGDQVTRLVAYYAAAHFSRFVRPGSVRLGSNDLEQLASVAFRTHDGKIVMVASNGGDFPKTFNIEYQGETVATTLSPGAVGTYIWSEFSHGKVLRSMSNPVHIPARSKQAIPDLMDLSSYYTSSLKEGNLDSLPEGVHAFSRAAFDIRGMIQLAGIQPSAYSDAVKGIAINYKGEKIDFLQGAAGRAEEDTVIGNYVLHYANGETKNIPLVYGRNGKDSFNGNAGPVLTGAAIAWSSETIQVFKYTANNPLPGVEIKTMDFVSNNKQAAPFLIAMTIEPAQAERSYEWLDSIKAWNPIPPRDPSATPDQVDLTKYYGTSLDDDWFDHPGHDLHDVPHGLQRFGGVLFDVRGLILLAGTQSLAISGLALPEAVMGIPVGCKGKAVDFLQAGAFQGTPAGTKVGEYVMHYENGETRTANLIYGENELDWWMRAAEGHVTKAKEVWYGSDAATRRAGLQIRLIKFTWNNPLPDVKITTMDFVSALTNCSPMLLAVTVEPSTK